MTDQTTRYAAIGNAKSRGGYSYEAVFEWTIHTGTFDRKSWRKGKQLGSSHTKGANILQAELKEYEAEGYVLKGRLIQGQLVVE